MRVKLFILITSAYIDKIIIMKINEFKLENTYILSQLADAFGRRVLYGSGINYSKEHNVILLISKHTKNSPYNDSNIHNGFILYTGEGQRGDQKLTNGNKRLLNSSKDNIDIHLFYSDEKNKYIYKGLFKLTGDIKYVDEPDVEGNLRKVIKFPLVKRNNGATLLSDDEMNDITGGGPGINKKFYNVVGAAILKNGTILCAQRNKDPLAEKWEFPGGKIEENETPVEALKREIKEELNIDIEICDKIDSVTHEYEEFIVKLDVFSCKHVSGELTNIEHKQLKWVKIEDLKTLDWAEADIPIVDIFVDSLPSTIVENINLNYFSNNQNTLSSREILRATQDYTLSQKKKIKSGERAEQAVIQFEKDKLINLGRSDLANKIEQVSKKSSDYGYDILSYEITNNAVVETHIEVKSTSLSSEFIEFFISQNELTKFKNDEHYCIYCLIKFGKDYKLHILKKEDFFKDNYLSPLTYKVKIKIKE